MSQAIDFYDFREVEFPARRADFCYIGTVRSDREGNTGRAVIAAYDGKPCAGYWDDGIFKGYPGLPATPEIAEAAAEWAYAD